MSGAHRFGDLALERGLVSREQLEAALSAQEGPGRPQLGQALVALGVLTPSQVGALLELQRVRRAGGPDADPLVGETLGGCLVLGVIGRGVMGTTYRAHHLRLDRDVAVKVLHPHLLQDSRAVERFMREARAVARLEHPGVVAVHDLDEEDGRRFIVMQYVDGRTLAELIAAEGPLDVERALRLGVQLARTLHAAHVAGIVHRDVKPANVLVRWDGAIKLADFGLIRLGDERPSPDDADLRLAVGTPNYMAPEQALGEDVDGRTDQYGLGTLLYEAISGRLPFSGDDLISIVRQHVEAPPPPIEGLPPGLWAALARLLAKRPADRFPDCAEAAAALRAVLAEATARRGGEASDRLPALAERVGARPAEAPPEEPPESEDDRARLEAVVVKLLAGDVAAALGDLERIERERLGEQVFAALWRSGRRRDLVALRPHLPAWRERWPRAYAFVARALTAEGRADEALEVLAEAPRLDDPLVLTEQVRALAVQGRRGDAARLLDLAARRFDDAAVVRRIGELRYQVLDDLAGAAREYGRLAALEPDRAEPRQLQGLLLLDAGEVDAARRALEDAVRRDPRAVMAWTLLGWACERLDQPSGARRAYEEVLRLTPEDRGVRRSLVRLLLAAGDRPAAVAAAEAGLTLSPGDRGLLELLEEPA